jgi:hypothetical protein
MEACAHPRGLKRTGDDAPSGSIGGPIDIDDLLDLLPATEDANESGAPTGPGPLLPGVPPTDKVWSDAPDFRVNLDDMFDVDEARAFVHPSFVPGVPLHLEAKRSPKGILIRTQTTDIHGDKFVARKIAGGTVLGARVQWFKAPHPFNCDVYLHNLMRVE